MFPECFIYLISRLDRSVLSPENHECILILCMSLFEKVEQAADKIMCEQTRADLDNIQQVKANPAIIEQAVDGPAIIEQVVVSLVKFELAAADPEVNCLVVSLCTPLSIP